MLSLCQPELTGYTPTVNLRETHPYVFIVWTRSWTFIYCYTVCQHRSGATAGSETRSRVYVTGQGCSVFGTFVWHLLHTFTHWRCDRFTDEKQWRGEAVQIAHTSVMLSTHPLVMRQTNNWQLFWKSIHRFESFLGKYFVFTWFPQSQ